MCFAACTNQARGVPIVPCDSDLWVGKLLISWLFLILGAKSDETG